MLSLTFNKKISLETRNVLRGNKTAVSQLNNNNNCSRPDLCYASIKGTVLRSLERGWCWGYQHTAHMSRGTKMLDSKAHVSKTSSRYAAIEWSFSCTIKYVMYEEQPADVTFVKSAQQTSAPGNITVTLQQNLKKKSDSTNGHDDVSSSRNTAQQTGLKHMYTIHIIKKQFCWTTKSIKVQSMMQHVQRVWM